MDGSHVPTDVVGQIHEGDRAVVAGRWIIDTGHYYKGQGSSPDPGFRTEIHPPLIMACANVYPPHDAGGTEYTRAIFTSRPYLTGQTFGRPETVYEDGVDDDGAFYAHMMNEVTKASELRSLSLEAHPKIKQKPFRDVQSFHFIVAPPAQPAPPVRSGTGLNILHRYGLNISFHFTVRNGCAVEVTSDGQVVNVYVSMNGTSYTPSPSSRPNRRLLLKATTRELKLAGR